jgi:hypothetical protein
MLLLGSFVVVLGSYFSFVARREGASVERALLAGVLCSGLLQAIISTGMVWLWDIGWTQMIEPVVIVWALAWVAALLGALTASPRRELIARWQPL